MNGLPWIQLDVDWPNSRKAIQLRVFLNDPWAWAYVVRLWCWTAQHAGHGVIEGPGCQDVIADAAGWRGDPKSFVDAMVRARLLDEGTDGYAVHDWEDYAGAHIEKREKERTRLRTYRKRTRTERVRNEYVHGERERERERDNDPSSQTVTEGLAVESVTMRAFRERLTADLRLPTLIAPGSPETQTFLQAQLDACGLECLVTDCRRIAYLSKTGVPSSLNYFPGWLKKLPLPKVAR